MSYTRADRRGRGTDAAGRSRQRAGGAASGDDEADRAPSTGSTDGRRRRRGPRVPSPMADLPAGAAFGTLVHAVLETTDPARPTCAPS